MTWRWLCGLLGHGHLSPVDTVLEHIPGTGWYVVCDRCGKWIRLR